MDLHGTLSIRAKGRRLYTITSEMRATVQLAFVSLVVDGCRVY